MRRFLIIILICILVLSLTTQLYTLLSITLSLIIFYCMLDKFGKGIVLMETMAFYACVIYLIMPLMGYSVYTRQSYIATLWKKQMPIPFETYYSFILPAICSYLLGQFIISYWAGRMDEGSKMNTLYAKIREQLSVPSKIGIVLIATGICFYFIKVYTPGPLAAVASFGYLLIFPGLLYVHFQPTFKGKIWIYLLVATFFLRDAISTGMFTVSFYMSITIVSFFLIGRKIRFPVKLAAVALGISGFFILQLVKGSFRKSAWKQTYTGSKAELFQNLVFKTAGNFNQIFSENAFFPIYLRLNQGWTTALVIRRIPAIQPYDEGASIVSTVAASMVPRVLWPDKPEAGGVYNMQHFAGFRIKGWSVNIGPVGEAYGNFGVNGGIIYMFFFGLFLGGAYTLVFRISRKKALIILWIPLLFFEVTYCMENDTLQALNSLIKAAFFLWILSLLFPSLFNTSKKINTKRHENRPHLRDNRPGWSLPG